MQGIAVFDKQTNKYESCLFAEKLFAEKLFAEKLFAEKMLHMSVVCSCAWFVSGLEIGGSSVEAQL